MSNKVNKTTKTSNDQSADDQAKTPRARNVKQTKKSSPSARRVEDEPRVNQLEDQGDLDEETLDRNAPYNKTYGITEE